MLFTILSGTANNKVEYKIPLNGTIFINAFLYFFLTGSSFEYYGCYMSVEENISYVNKTFMSRSICIEYCQIGHYSLAALSVSYHLPISRFDDTFETVLRPDSH